MIAKETRDSKYVDGHIHYDGTPDLMAKYAIMARDSGAKIIGGCCGTKPEHLASMRNALETNPLMPPPSVEQIELEIGPFTSSTKSETESKKTRRRRRRA